MFFPIITPYTGEDVIRSYLLKRHVIEFMPCEEVIFHKNIETYAKQALAKVNLGTKTRTSLFLMLILVYKDVDILDNSNFENAGIYRKRRITV